MTARKNPEPTDAEDVIAEVTEPESEVTAERMAGVYLDEVESQQAKARFTEAESD